MLKKIMVLLTIVTFSSQASIHAIDIMNCTCGKIVVTLPSLENRDVVSIKEKEVLLIKERFRQFTMVVPHMKKKFVIGDEALKNLDIGIDDVNFEINNHDKKVVIRELLNVDKETVFTVLELSDGTIRIDRFQNAHSAFKWIDSTSV